MSYCQQIVYGIMTFRNNLYPNIFLMVVSWVYIQHGGYGIAETHPKLDHEIVCSDEFISWGWDQILFVPSSTIV